MKMAIVFDSKYDKIYNLEAIAKFINSLPESERRNHLATITATLFYNTIDNLDEMEIVLAWTLKNIMKTKRFRLLAINKKKEELIELQNSLGNMKD